VLFLRKQLAFYQDRTHQSFTLQSTNLLEHLLDVVVRFLRLDFQYLLCSRIHVSYKTNYHPAATARHLRRRSGRCRSTTGAKPRTTSQFCGRTRMPALERVADSDRGRLIGRGGANMRALRVLLNPAAYVCGTRYRVTCNAGSVGAHGSHKFADERYKFAHHGDA
jgi:hypothetical protein